MHKRNRKAATSPLTMAFVSFLPSPWSILKTVGVINKQDETERKLSLLLCFLEFLEEFWISVFLSVHFACAQLN